MQITDIRYVWYLRFCLALNVSCLIIMSLVRYASRLIWSRSLGEMSGIHHWTTIITNDTKFCKTYTHVNDNFSNDTLACPASMKTALSKSIIIIWIHQRLTVSTNNHLHFNLNYSNYCCTLCACVCVTEHFLWRVSHCKICNSLSIVIIT